MDAKELKYSPTASPVWRLVSKKHHIIVPFNTDRKGLPIYFVHSVGGEVTTYYQLARQLDADHKFCGIQAPIRKFNEIPGMSIELLARHYVKAVQNYQPEGPLVLGGWSVGAVIALEMAHQLQSRGREVRGLVVLDGNLTNAVGGLRPWDLRYYYELARNVPNWITQDLVEEFRRGGLRRRVQRKLYSAIGRHLWLGNDASRPHALDGFIDTSGWPSAQVSFARKLYDAGEAYVPKPYRGRVLVYAATTGPLTRLNQVEASWTSVACCIETLRLDGTHLSIIQEPRVIDLANHLRDQLRRVEGV